MRPRRLLELSVLAALCLAVFAPAAGADSPIVSVSVVPGLNQAGGHPDVEIKFTVDNRISQSSTSLCNCEDAKNAAVHFPAGFIGDPHAAPQCSLAEFASATCPIDSQIGVVHIVPEAVPVELNAPVYNLIPPPDVAGLTGFKVFSLGGPGTPQFQVLSARTDGDYGLDSTSTSIFHTYPLRTLQEVIWGVPADPIHDPLRFDPKLNVNAPGVADYLGSFCSKITNPTASYQPGILSTEDPNTVRYPCYTNFMILPSVSSNSPLKPFLQNPTNCDEPLVASLDVLSYDGGTTHADTPWPQMTGCDQLSFNPSLYAQPTTHEADTASGIDINLTIPQEVSSAIPSPTELRGAIVTLPPGFSINPNAADGKTSCSDAEANFGTTLAADCPDFSKIGSLEIDSSALPGPVPGYVYIGKPLPGNRYRIFLVADGFATHIKLAGTVTPDPQNGRLVITFTNLPQSPLTAFDMHFFGSERGILATPTECGTYPVTTTFTPWDSSHGAQTSTQFFTLESGPNGEPCPGLQRPFNPSFDAGVGNKSAGAHAPFMLDIARADGDQNLSGLNVTTPPGFSGTLVGIPYCPEAALAALADSNYTGAAEKASPSCPAASQIGTAQAGAGAGTHPVFLEGKVYLAGPYRGAPLSLAVVTPAVSGPYDLGNVVVRAAIHINPETAQITAVSDPLPQILDGIPLRLREIEVYLGRRDFTLNPTSCAPSSINARLFGDQGASVNSSVHFQVANCGDLGFSPKLALKLAGATKRAKNPALSATLTYPAGPNSANLSSTEVVLPPSELIDNAHIQAPCTLKQFAQSACPASTIIGFAKAETPLLEKPLTGPVYLRNGSHKLPDIVAALNGQIGEIDLVGHVDSIHARIRARFGRVPDAPVSRFTLNLYGGKKGLIQNTESLCSQPQIAAVTMDAQNGKSVAGNQKVRVPCNSQKQKRAGRGRRR